MIRNIIFDFGDVFINLDKSATFRELQKLGYSELPDDLQNLFLQYETGTISSSEFLSKAGVFFPETKPGDLVSAWNAILLDLPLSRLEFLESVKSEGKYRLFLLSNTNELHIAHVEHTVGEDQFKRFKDCFEKVYFSYELLLRKPDPEIFRLILDNHMLQAEETLFIDDTAEHVASAKKLGLKVWHLNPEGEDIRTLKEKLE